MKRFPWLIILFLLSLPAVRALFAPGFYTSHDNLSHLTRIAQYVTALKDGQIPPRWAAGLIGNLGSAIFNYTYQLPYFLSSLAYFLGASIQDSLKLVFGLSYVLSGIGAYLWLREFFSKKASFVGTLFFLYAPYRFILMYVRAAVGEHLALALLPFLFWLVTALIKRPSLKKISLTALALAALITSHSLFLTIYFPLVVSYCLILFKRRSTKPLVIALVLGLGLASFNLLPQLFERSYIVFDQNYPIKASSHLVTPWQLVHSPWGYGYSHQGTAEDAMSFQVGLTQLLVLGLAAGLMLKTRSALTGWAVGWMLLVLGLMIDSSASQWFWNNAPFVDFFDFPWRLLGITVVSASFLAAWVVDSVKTKTLAGLILSVLILVANRNHLRTNQPYNQPDEFYFNYSGTASYLNEYRQIWRKTNSIELVKPRLLTDENQEKIEILADRSNLLWVQADFDRPTLIQINISYFPGWNVYRKVGKKWKKLSFEKEVFLTREPLGNLTWENANGTLQTLVPAGNQQIKISFERTALRLFADLVSALALAYSLIMPARRINFRALAAGQSTGSSSLGKSGSLSKTVKYCR